MLAHLPELKLLLTTTVVVQQTFKRSFFSYFRIAFNNVDADRLQTVGPDRLCAEWMLKNGGAISNCGSVGTPINNYNLLPPTTNRNSHVCEIDGTDSSIMDIGFEHFKGCNHIKKINLTRCKHIENDAMQKLATHLHGSLEELSVIDCFNIQTAGLMHLAELHKLKRLVVSGVPYVKDVAAIQQLLTAKLPQCDVNISK